ncbi:MAG: hypothetical protein M0010_21260 [Actinomycetota bacterium]|nr:hypothetical protein [Actinomycetota bacterium]
MVTTSQKARRRDTRPPAQPLLDWYEDESEEVPNPELPDGRRLARRQRWTRRYVKASVILCPVLTLVALASITRSHPSAPGTSLGSPGRTAATIAVDQWLSETPSPLPGASILSYDGAQAIPVPKAHQGDPLTWRAAIETFTLVSQATSTSPASWDVGVEVAIDRSGGAVAISGPSFLPSGRAQNGSWDAGGPWPGLSSTSSVSGAVQTVINDWLAAYTSGNDAELHLAVGDPDPKHTYVALSGVRRASDTVVAASPIGNANQDEMIAEVELNLLWNHEHESPPSLEGTSGPSGPQTTMDLLIAHASSAAPVVVAWGPPGSGPTLRPYENAIGG